MVLGGVGAVLATLALIGDFLFLLVHDARLHFDVHVVLGLAGLLAGFAALGSSLSLVLQGLGERQADGVDADPDRVGRSAETTPGEGLRPDG